VAKTCAALGCRRRLLARGFCEAHYARFKRTGEASPDRPIGPGRPALVAARKQPCTVGGCLRTRLAKGLCGMHYARKQRTGTVEARPKRVSPPCEVGGCGRTSWARGLCNRHYAQWHGREKPHLREGQRSRSRERYALDPDYRAKMLAGQASRSVELRSAKLLLEAMQAEQSQKLAAALAKITEMENAR
jgi:hypothetical protein